MVPILFKITFIPGLQDIVSQEISQFSDMQILETGKQAFYIDIESNIQSILSLKSVLNVYVVKRGTNFNPSYVSNHKSILGELIEKSLKGGDIFKTYSLSCAGAHSKEVQEIEDFIYNTFHLEKSDEADLEIYIGKNADIWEVGVRLTKRPLSLRSYKTSNIKGGMNSTIAYAMNTFCNLSEVHSYLNIFSGSATLLIEAGLVNSDIQLIGFDNNKEHVTAAIRNISSAGLIKHIQIKYKDILNAPDLGTFDVITSDLPFGMHVSKGEDLEKLYQCFVSYSEKYLNQGGILVAYTAEHEILKTSLLKSRFSILKELQLEISTSVNVYLHPKIFVCVLK
jgi:16S rRNA G966 N2-methylase RsmD